MIAGIIIVIVGFLVWIFVTKQYPVVIVGTGYISQSYQNQARDLSHGLDPKLTNSAVADQLVKTKKEQQLVAKLKISFDNSVIADELKFDITSKSEEYQNLLQKYFNSDENLFTEFIVRPQAYEALLRIKYNSDFDLNSSPYNQAQNILNQIKLGSSFESVVKTESDDQITGQLGGDLGFVLPGQILPELEKVLTQAKVGEVYPNIIVSRTGYNILYPVETAEKSGAKLWHVKYILIKTTGFEDWLDPQLKQFVVWRLIQ